jgi:hypothetical protein
MKLEWLEPTVVSGKAHLCATDEKGNVLPCCPHIFLTGAAPAEAETPKCEECLKIVRSGKEISVMVGPNQKVVLRPEMPAAYIGSLDPFEDAVQAFKHMGVFYCLLVGMQGDPRMRFWTNAPSFGRVALEGLRREFDNILEAVEKQIEARESGG